MDSWLLDQTTWDLVIDANRNWALASSPYSTAQDVACAARTFSGELIFDQDRGIPYFEEIFGKTPPLQLVQARITEESLTVPEVAKARTIVSRSDIDGVSGEIQIIDTDGEEANIDF